MSSGITLATHPARLAAKAAGEKRFRADGFPCLRGHLERYTDSGACAECMLLRRSKELKPMSDVDVDITQARLIRANTKFVKLLHLEALTAIRNVPDEDLSKHQQAL